LNCPRTGNRVVERINRPLQQLLLAASASAADDDDDVTLSDVDDDDDEVLTQFTRSIESHITSPALAPRTTSDHVTTKREMNHVRRPAATTAAVQHAMAKPEMTPEIGDGRRENTSTKDEDEARAVSGEDLTTATHCHDVVVRENSAALHAAAGQVNKLMEPETTNNTTTTASECSRLPLTAEHQRDEHDEKRDEDSDAGRASSSSSSSECQVIDNNNKHSISCMFHLFYRNRLTDGF